MRGARRISADRAFVENSASRVLVVETAGVSFQLDYSSNDPCAASPRKRDLSVRHEGVQEAQEKLSFADEARERFDAARRQGGRVGQNLRARYTSLCRNRRGLRFHPDTLSHGFGVSLSPPSIGSAANASSNCRRSQTLRPSIRRGLAMVARL